MEQAKRIVLAAPAHGRFLVFFDGFGLSGVNNWVGLCWLALGRAGGACGLVSCLPELAVPDFFLPLVVLIEKRTTRKGGGNIIEWWSSFSDPNGVSLVDRALESNLDLEIALTRLQEARTQEIVVIGESLPAGEASGGGGAGTGTNMTLSRASSVLIPLP